MTPRPVTMPQGVVASRIAVGSYDTLFTTPGGALYGWGTSAVLPTGATGDELAPIEFTNLPQGTSAVLPATLTSGYAGYVLARVHPVFTQANPPLSATVGTPYTATFAASGYPVPTFALAQGAPAWLSIDATTGAVGGTPTGPGQVSYSVIASNGSGQGDSVTAGPFAVTVVPASPTAPQFLAAAPPAGQVNVGYGAGLAGYQFTASGYPAPKLRRALRDPAARPAAGRRRAPARHAHAVGPVPVHRPGIQRREPGRRHRDARRGHQCAAGIRDDQRSARRGRRSLRLHVPDDGLPGADGHEDRRDPAAGPHA